MASALVLALEALFFIITLFGSAVAIYELRRARKMLSDNSLKGVITWMIYSSFILSAIAFAAAANFIVSLQPDLAEWLIGEKAVTFLFGLIWLSIACNIVIAMKMKEVGAMFGFKETGEKELKIVNLFTPKKK
ncbi:MAG: hypothetical protein V1835_00770 [Candidatus Micrarchaeota archaeon]